MTPKHTAWQHFLGSLVKRLLAAVGGILVARGILTPEESDVAQGLLGPEVVEIIFGLVLLGLSWVNSRVFPGVRERIAHEVNAQPRPPTTTGQLLGPAMKLRHAIEDAAWAAAHHVAYAVAAILDRLRRPVRVWDWHQRAEQRERRKRTRHQRRGS